MKSTGFSVTFVFEKKENILKESGIGSIKKQPSRETKLIEAKVDKQ